MDPVLKTDFQQPTLVPGGKERESVQLPAVPDQPDSKASSISEPDEKISTESFPDKPHRWRKVAWYIDTYWPIGAVIVGTVGLTFFDKLKLPEQVCVIKIWWCWVVASVSALLFAAGTLAAFSRQEKVLELQRQLRHRDRKIEDKDRKLAGQRSVIESLGEALEMMEFDYYRMLESQLELLSTSLSFSDSERVTVYKKDDGKFTRLGRFSNNGLWCQASGRDSYPEGQGIIGQTWINGEVFVEDLPDRSDHEENYLSAQKAQGFINKSVARKLRMPTRSYAGMCIKNPLAKEKVAVIIFESTKSGAFSARKDELREKLKSLQIEVFIEKLKVLEPQRDIAEKEGPLNMTELREIVAYLLKHYPYKTELSKARLTKMVYLADWRAAITSGRQLTPIHWEFNYHGPYVHDIASLADSDPLFVKTSTQNMYGQWKELIALNQPSYEPKVPPTDKEILDHVIQHTKSKTWQAFIKLVYSTYPIRTQPRFSKLDLVSLAKDYEREKSSPDSLVLI